MTEYVPARAVRQLAKRARSDGDLFEDDTPAQRLGHKLAADLEECVDEKAVSEVEVCGE